LAPRFRGQPERSLIRAARYAGYPGHAGHCAGIVLADSRRSGTLRDMIGCERVGDSRQVTRADVPGEGVEVRRR